MIKITSKNETTAFIDAPKEVISGIAEALQFRPEGYLFNPKYKAGIWDGWIRPVDYYGKFQKGLLEDVELILQQLHLSYEIDKRAFPVLSSRNIELCSVENITNDKGQFIRPFDYQIDASKIALKKKRCIIRASTGAGKSLLQYLIIKSVLEDNPDSKILLVVPTVSLVTQMFNDYKDYSSKDDSFDTDELCHMVMGGKEKYTKKPVTISTWQSIVNIDDPDFFKSFDCVLVDEAHKASSSSITSILNKCERAQMKVGFSGTVQKTKTHLTALKGLFGQVYQVTTTKDLIERNILSELKIKTILLNHSGDIPAMLYKDELDYIVQHRKRNKFIINLVDQTEGNSLILFQLVEKQGKVLYDMVKEKYPNRDVFFIHGGVKPSIREETRKLVEKADNAVIIASYQTFQEGINIKKLHNVIFASPSKSEIRVFQSIGRGLRKHETKSAAVLYDIADKFQNLTKKNHTLKHFEERLKMYESEGFAIKQIELSV